MLAIGNKPFILLPPKAECSFFFCDHKLFFGGGGGEGEIKDKLQRIPRVLLSGKILGLFLSAEFSQ